MTSAALALRPESTAVIGRMRATAADLHAALPVLTLETPEQEARAAQLLRAVATLRAEGEKARKAEKDPHLRAGQAVDRAFKDPDRLLDEVERQLRRRIAEATERRERARREALEAAAQAARAGDVERANEAMTVASDPVFAPVEIAGVSERWTWEPVSVDLRAVPREYLVLDMPKVRAEVASALREGREPAIPGIVFEKRANVTVRRL